MKVTFLLENLVPTILTYTKKRGGEGGSYITFNVFPGVREGDTISDPY